jgi:hypothetical protein
MIWPTVKLSSPIFSAHRTVFERTCHIQYWSFLSLRGSGVSRSSIEFVSSSADRYVVRTVWESVASPPDFRRFFLFFVGTEDENVLRFALTVRWLQKGVFVIFDEGSLVLLMFWRKEVLNLLSIPRFLEMPAVQVYLD